MTLYLYVGPREIRQHAMNTARFEVRGSFDVALWAQTQEVKRHEALWATFTIDSSGALWIADRRSEHIGCSRGEPVQTAGELAFLLNSDGAEVVEATNQSTGFCPAVESWAALTNALNKAGIVRPDGWTTAFEFRRCLNCQATNIVKDGWLVCAQCDADLPLEWNFDAVQK